MKCKPAEKLMLDYIEGTLLPKQKDRLEIHLGTCPHCQRVLFGYEKTLQLAASLPVKYPSPDAWGGFWQKLKSKISQDVPDDEPVWLIAHKWKIAGVGFILVALLGFAGLWSYGVFNNSAEGETFVRDGIRHRPTEERVQDTDDRDNRECHTDCPTAHFKTDANRNRADNNIEWVVIASAICKVRVFYNPIADGENAACDE